MFACLIFESVRFEARVKMSIIVMVYVINKNIKLCHNHELTLQNLQN